MCQASSEGKVVELQGRYDAVSSEVARLRQAYSDATSKATSHDSERFELEAKLLALDEQNRMVADLKASLSEALTMKVTGVMRSRMTNRQH